VQNVTRVPSAGGFGAKCRPIHGKRAPCLPISTFVPPTDHLIGKRRDATRIFYRSGGLTAAASPFDSQVFAP
jgi:hypothetical protein